MVILYKDSSELGANGPPKGMGMTVHPIKINQEPRPPVHLPLWVPSVKLEIQERKGRIRGER